MTNRIGINLTNLCRLIPINGKYVVIRHHELDRTSRFFAESVTLGGAVFFADSGFLEDEINYNDCEELEGMGAGFSYLVISPIGEIVYKKQRIELN